MGATTPEKLVRAGAKGTLSLTAVQGVTMALGYVGQIVLARLLLPAGFGQFTVALTMLVTVEVLVIEAPRAYSWALARDPAALGAVRASLLRRFLPFCLAVGGLFALGGLGVSALLGDRGLAGLMAIASLDIPLLGLLAALRWVMVGLFRYREQVVSGAGGAVAKLACTVGLVLARPCAEMALAATVAGTGFGLLLSWALLRPSLRGGAGPLAVARLGRFGVWFTVSGFLAFAASSADLWLLKGLGTAAAWVGLYGAGYVVSRALVQLSAGLAAGIFPVVSRLAAEGDRERGRDVLRQANRVLLLAGLPVVAIVAACSRELLTLFFSARYEGGGPMMRLLMGSGWAMAMAMVVQGAACAAGRLRACAAANAMALVVAVACSAALIPRLGPVGASAASLAASLSVCAASLAIAGRVFGNVLPLSSLPWALAGAAAGGLVAWACPGQGWVLVGRMALAAGAACVLVVPGLREEDRRALGFLWRWLIARSPAEGKPVAKGG